MKVIINSLNQIMNGQKVGANIVVCLHSKVLDRILDILTEEGFIRGFFKHNTGSFSKCHILLKYVNDKGAIRNIIFESKPGSKSFKKYKQLNKSFNGIGLLVMSTNKGIITNEQAFSQKVGGQPLFKIY